MSNNIFDQNKIRWYHYLIHLGYYISYWIKFFFNKPFKVEKKKDLDLLEKVSTLLDSGITDKNISYSRELVHLHRIVENTRARRRLEKWSLTTIASYLVIAAVLVISNYSPLLSGSILGLKISPTIMITILSTTTVNIIGLGLIVLRGHFLANDRYNDLANTKDKKKEITE